MQLTKILNFFVILCLIPIGLWLNKNLNFYYVPNPDVFQFIDDGKLYLQGKLPDNIHAPPANPIALSLIAKFIPTQYPELHAAIGLNIILGLLTAFFIWKVGHIYLGNLGGVILFFLVISNPIFYHVSLNTTSEVWFALNLTLILYLRLLKKYPLAYLLAGLTLLFRYEAIIFVPILTLVDFFSFTNRRLILRWFILGIIPVICWLLIINQQNNTGNLTGNTFLTEIINRAYMLPLTEMITTYPGHFMFDTPIDYHQSQLIIYAFTLIGIIVFLKKATPRAEMFVTVLIFCGYIIIHLCFPAYDPRYLFPILWLIYLFNLWPFLFLPSFPPKPKFDYYLNVCMSCLIFLPFLYLIFHNTVNIKTFLFNMNNIGLENRLTAEWLNQHYANKPAIVLSLEPWITKYYVENTNLTFFNPSNFETPCETIDCIHQQLDPLLKNLDILIVRDSYTDTAAADNFNAQAFGVRFLQSFKSLKPENNTTVIAHLYKDQNWALIYKYIPPPQ